jgi:hypothetical protein
VSLCFLAPAIEREISALVLVSVKTTFLTDKRPKSIQRLYEEFEKYCLSDNDFRMCMEE